MAKHQKLDLLVAVYIFCIVASELMGAKTFPLVQFSWLHLNASVAIFLVPVVYSVNDIVVEVWGRERARSLIRAGILVVFLSFVFAAIATALPPSARSQGSELAYDKVFKSSMRIASASLVAFAVAETLDILVFSKLRERMQKKALWFRNNISNFVAQLADTTIFITLAFYAFGKSFDSNLSFLVSLIVPYWLLKCAFSVIETPFVYAGVKWLKDSK
jgi:uncharacterized integral membrane protein (TIGR00697 family)